MQFASMRRSLPPALPYTVRLTRRCISLISLIARISSARTTLFCVSSCTAFRRLRMAATDSSGRSTQLRSMRLPIAVPVLSSTQSRLPFFSPVLRDSVSSRLRRAV